MPVRPNSLSRPVAQGAHAATTLVCRDVCLDRGAEPVLAHVSFSIGPGTCLGVVGPNGVGKSTLLKVLAGIEVPDSGTVELAPPGASCMYVEQERVAETARTETVRQALVRRSGVEQAVEELTQAA